MIRKGHVNKQYNPKDFNNEVRRASQFKVDAKPLLIPLNSAASRLLLYYPLAMKTLRKLFKVAEKIIRKSISFQTVKIEQRSDNHGSRRPTKCSTSCRN